MPSSPTSRRAKRGWSSRLLSLAASGAMMTALVVLTAGPASAAPPVLDLGSNLTLDEGGGFAIFPTVTDDGTIVSYAWDLGDGRTSTDSFISTAYADEGVYTIRLTVTDDDGDTATDTVTATVSNVPPEVTFTPESSRVPPGVTRRFEAEGFDAGDDTLTYAWTFGDGGTATGPSVSHAWANPGSYTVAVRVSDGDGGSASASARITVRSVVADAGPDQTVNEGQVVSLGGLNTTAEDAFTSFDWDFGDGDTSRDRLAQHAYDDEGTYRATLTVTDDGGSRSDDAVVTVRNVAPSIAGIAVQGDAQPGAPTSLKVFASDPGADTLTAAWDFGDGSTGSGIAVRHRYADPGVYTATVTVSDGDGGSDSATHEVRVGAPVSGLPDSAGRDFWLDFDANSTIDDTTRLTLFISSETATQGVVEIPGIGFSTPFAVGANSVTSVAVPTSAMLGEGDATDLVEPRAVHVTADADVTVHGLSHSQFTSDGFLGQPVDADGTRYRVLSYGTDFAGSELSVVPTANNTTVTITPSATTPGHDAGDPYTVNLDLGDAYEVQTSGPGDLTGTVISSDAPVSVFGGHRCADIPTDIGFCNHLVEQLAPTTAWGRHFATGPLAGRTADTVRVLADTDDTQVTVRTGNGTDDVTLGAGEVHEFTTGVPTAIDADKPVAVAQYSNGSAFDDSVADPFMAVVPPVDQFLSSYTIATPATGFRDNFVNLVVPSTATSSLRVDGDPVAAGQFTAVPGSAYAAASVRVGTGVHRLTAAEPFGATVYGFDTDDAYGYPGGSAGGAIAALTSLTITPDDQTAVVGDQACVVVAAIADDGAGLPGIRVAVAITGAHPDTLAVTTGADGSAPLCYTADTAGVDALSADAADHQASAQVTWRLRDTNQAPTADDQSLTLDEDTPTPITLTASDPEDAALTFEVVEQPAHGALTGDAPDLVYTPDANFNGSDELAFVASDGDRFSDPATVSLTITPVNDPPTITDPGSVTVDAGALVSVPITAVDPDGTTPSVSVESGPPGLSLVDGAVTWQTTLVDGPGTYPATLLADDGDGGTAEVTFTITVRAPGAPSVRLSTDSATVDYSDSISPIDIVVDNAGGPGADLSLAVTGLPDSLAAAPLAYDSDNGSWGSQITGRASDVAGDYPIEVTVTTADGSSTTAAGDIVVRPENVAVTSDTDPIIVDSASGAPVTVPISLGVAEEADGELSQGLPGSGGTTDAAPVTVTALAGDGTAYTCTVSALSAAGAGAASGGCGLASVPVGVYDVTLNVGNARFAGSGTATLIVRPPATSAVSIWGRGRILADPSRPIDFAVSGVANAAGQVLGGLSLHSRTGGGWIVRSTALTALTSARLSPGVRTGEVTASGLLSRGPWWQQREHGGWHGHWPHGHWPHGHWPHGHGHRSPAAAARGSASGAGPYGRHCHPGHHGRDDPKPQQVTVHLFVEDGGSGKPSPDLIWIGVYDLAGNLIPDISSPGAPPADAQPLAWGRIRVSLG